MIIRKSSVLALLVTASQIEILAHRAEAGPIYNFINSADGNIDATLDFTTGFSSTLVGATLFLPDTSDLVLQSDSPGFHTLTGLESGFSIAQDPANGLALYSSGSTSGAIYSQLFLRFNADSNDSVIAIPFADRSYGETGVWVLATSTSVPEPSTLVMSSILLGLFGVFGLCKRPKRAAPETAFSREAQPSAK